MLDNRPVLKTALIRFARVAAAGAIAAVAVALPGLIVAVPPAYLFIANAVVAAALVALDKARRAVNPENPPDEV